MTDFFAVLAEDRRPWIEPNDLKEKFLEMSAKLHPDRVHGGAEPEQRAAHERYIELNAAYSCLREPRDRLRHLLQLELGSKPADVQPIGPELMAASLEVTGLCREIDALLLEKKNVSSPLLKVSIFERGQALAEKAVELSRTIDQRRHSVFGRLKEMNANWPSSNCQSQGVTDVLPRLEEACRLLGYYDRWTSQIRERIVQLNMP